MERTERKPVYAVTEESVAGAEPRGTDRLSDIDEQIALLKEKKRLIAEQELTSEERIHHELDQYTRTRCYYGCRDEDLRIKKEIKRLELHHKYLPTGSDRAEILAILEAEDKRQVQENIKGKKKDLYLLRKQVSKLEKQLAELGDGREYSYAPPKDLDAEICRLTGHEPASRHIGAPCTRCKSGTQSREKKN